MTTTNDPFARPASASGVDWADNLGKLLLIEPSGFESGVNTSNGPKDAVRATVTVIDAADGPDVYNDALIFPLVLIGQTKSLIGSKVLGRLGQGTAKPGQNAPWRLDDPTDADVAAGKKYLDNRNPFNAPTASADAEPPF